MYKVFTSFDDTEFFILLMADIVVLATVVTNSFPGLSPAVLFKIFGPRVAMVAAFEFGFKILAGI